MKVKKEGLLKMLKSIENKNEQQSEAIRDEEKSNWMQLVDLT